MEIFLVPFQVEAGLPRAQIKIKALQEVSTAVMGRFIYNTKILRMTFMQAPYFGKQNNIKCKMLKDSDLLQRDEASLPFQGIIYLCPRERAVEKSNHDQEQHSFCKVPLETPACHLTLGHSTGPKTTVPTTLNAKRRISFPFSKGSSENAFFIKNEVS